MKPVYAWMLLAALLCAVVASAVTVVRTAHDVRVLHARLDQMAATYDAMLAEKTRLLLEKEALASYAHVERTAVEKLTMHFPEHIAPVGEQP